MSKQREVVVLGTGGSGLTAAGNVMASPMGMTYGGAGGTIAPGMVFGSLAGRHAAGHPVFRNEQKQRMQGGLRRTRAAAVG
jgi:hypothetical protein